MPTYAQPTADIKPLEIRISINMRELVRISREAFDQQNATLVARPMGLEIETCRLVAEVCRRLLNNECQLLQPLELKALYYALEFARRDLCSEFHAEMRELQKTMASIVTARTSGAIKELASQLAKEAEQAHRRLQTVLKKRGDLLDECEGIIERLRKHLRLPKPAD
ncbi:MAG: hypothetical protein AB1489_03200 [Acidobacteriota bacterium]